jgi:hypothetical protein
VRAEEEERRGRREAWRQARREEADRDKRRVLEKERQLRLAEQARQFHRHLTVRQFGFRPWLRLVIGRRVETRLADDLYRTKTKR